MIGCLTETTTCVVAKPIVFDNNSKILPMQSKFQIFCRCLKSQGYFPNCDKDVLSEDELYIAGILSHLLEVNSFSWLASSTSSHYFCSFVCPLILIQTNIFHVP